MATTYRITICPACAQSVQLPAKACPVCRAAFDQAVQEGTQIEAALYTARPTNAQVQAILACPQRSAGITGREIGMALRNFLITCALGVGMFLFGLWVTGNFRGLGVIFFGVVPLIASPVAVGYGVAQLVTGLFASRRGKTPKAAFGKVWTSGYFNSISLTDSSATAASRVYRSMPDVPGAASAADLTDYVDALKKWMQAALDAEESRLPPIRRLQDGTEDEIAAWSIASADPALVPGSITCTALASNVQEVTGQLRVVRKRTKSITNDKTLECTRSTLLLSITCYCVHHGKYWLVTDARPPLPALPELPMLDAVPAV